MNSYIFHQTSFSSSPSSNTRTPSPTTASGPKDEARKTKAVISGSDLILASATSASVSDSPAPLHRAGVDQSLTAVSAPDPHSLIQLAPAANLKRPKTGNAPQQRMTTGEPSGAESLPSRKLVNPYEDMPQGQTTASESLLPSSRSKTTSKAKNAPPEIAPERQTTRESSAESLPPRTLVNPFEGKSHGQTAPSQSSPPSVGSKTRSKGANSTTTILQPGTSGAKSDYKPCVTLAKGADPSVRKGPDDSLLL